jgi:hypothetical protein
MCAKSGIDQNTCNVPHVHARALRCAGTRLLCKAAFKAVASLVVLGMVETASRNGLPQTAQQWQMSNHCFGWQHGTIS